MRYDVYSSNIIPAAISIVNELVSMDDFYIMGNHTIAHELMIKSFGFFILSFVRSFYMLLLRIQQTTQYLIGNKCVRLFVFVPTSHRHKNAAKLSRCTFLYEATATTKKHGERVKSVGEFRCMAAYTYSISHLLCAFTSISTSKLKINYCCHT